MEIPFCFRPTCRLILVPSSGSQNVLFSIFVYITYAKTMSHSSGSEKYFFAILYRIFQGIWVADHVCLPWLCWIIRDRKPTQRIFVRTDLIARQNYRVSIAKEI